MKTEQVRRGSARVHILPTRHGKYSGWLVRWTTAGKRYSKHLASRDKALALAKDVAAVLDSGDRSLLGLTGDDAAAYRRASEILSPWGLTVEIASAQYSDLLKRAGETPLSQMVDFWFSHHPADVDTKTPAEILPEMLTAKAQDGLSEVYLRDLRFRLSRFTQVFQAPLARITATQLEAWLRTIPGARNRNNSRRAVHTLVNFAKARRYLGPNWAEINHVSVAKEAPQVIEIFTPTEIRKILAAADPPMVPFLAIGAFAGLRHAELGRLDWSQVGADYITVNANQAKTGRRRLVPILPNLKTWLDPHRKESGQVCPFANIANQITAISAASGVHWKHNALRHSFISYRLAIVQDTSKVALEAGNSPREIFDSYRELVSNNDAKQWFNSVFCRNKRGTKKRPNVASY